MILSLAWSYHLSVFVSTRCLASLFVFVSTLRDRVSTMETIPYPFSHLAKLNTVFARKNFCVKSTFDKLIGGKLAWYLSFIINNPCSYNPCSYNPCSYNPCNYNPCSYNPCSYKSILVSYNNQGSLTLIRLSARHSLYSYSIR